MNPLTSDTNEAARRVQVLPAPVVSPGNCGICGKSDHPQGFADARLDFEWYGTFYLCADCVGEYARAFGYIDESQYQKLLDHIETQGAMLTWYEEKFAKMEAVLGEPYIPVQPVTGANITSISNVDAGDAEELSEEPVGTEPPNFVIAPEQHGREQATLKLVSEQESVGVSGDSSSNNTDPLGL